MKCPFCFHEKTGVFDSRTSNVDDRCVKRRRKCEACEATFTTTEIPHSDRELEKRLENLRIGEMVLSLPADEQEFVTRIINNLQRGSF